MSITPHVLHFAPIRRVAVMLALIAGLAVVPAGMAAAAPPANDTPDGATAVTFGDRIEQDTTEATTDASDADLNEFCGAPETAASVWFTLTPDADSGAVIDMYESDYLGGFLVFEGAPTADSLITCGPDEVAFGVTAGTTYYIMAIDDGGNGGTVPGGNLVMNVAETGAPPTLEFDVDPWAKVSKDGTATLTGSYSCTDADFIDFEAELTQTVGRFKISGWGYTFYDGTCDGTEQQWSLPISGDNGNFAGGKGATVVFSFACGDFECADGYVEQTVKLRGRRSLN